ncbi:GAF domain-containing protein [Agrobacterium vitis]
MRRFILRENIRRFEERLKTHEGAEPRGYLKAAIDAARSELSALEHIWLKTCPEIGFSLSTGEDCQDLLDHAVAAHRSAFGSLQIWNENCGHLSLVAQTNFDVNFTERFAVVKMSDGTVFAKAFGQGAPALIADIQEADIGSDLREWALVAGIRSICSYPIIAEGVSVGIYSLHFREPHQMLPADDVLVSSFSSRFAQLLSSARSSKG